MAVRIDDITRVHDLYLDEKNQLWVLESFCLEPTATLKNVLTGARVSGGSGSLMLKPFRSIMEESDYIVSRGFPEFVQKYLAQAQTLRQWQKVFEMVKQKMSRPDVPARTGRVVTENEKRLLKEVELLKAELNQWKRLVMMAKRIIQRVDQTPLHPELSNERERGDLPSGDQILSE